MTGSIDISALRALDKLIEEVKDPESEIYDILRKREFFEILKDEFNDPGSLTHYFICLERQIMDLVHENESVTKDLATLKHAVDLNANNIDSLSIMIQELSNSVPIALRSIEPNSCVWNQLTTRFGPNVYFVMPILTDYGSKVNEEK